ncbi:alpha/beta fold hydrolase [Kribbella sp. NPDC056951]|uniref:alpha/beta fold hydrolase n=1 Tax=Kribbella sp. NPDC056951 TaxID=3345978 RepID=UPI003638CAAD
MYFKSAAGRDAVHEQYRALLAQWPVPNEQRLVPTGAGDTFVVSCGPADAPPLVLLHGSASTSLDWIDDISAWSVHYRVHAVDLLGDPGLSAEVRPELDSDDHAVWLDDVLEGLGIQGSVLMVGSSLGGWIGTDYAIRRPGKVRKLALLSPSGIGRQKSLIYLPAIFLLPWGRWGVLQTMRLVAGPLPAERRRDTGEFALLVHKHFQPRRVQLPIFTDDQLSKLDLMVIVGGRDRMLDSQETARRLPNATVVLPNAGHVLPSQTDHVLNWLLEDR